MPSPKSSDPPSIVKPTKPNCAHDADNSSPGQMEEIKQQQQQTKTGKYGSTPSTPPKKDDESKQKKSWIKVVLIDDADQPVPGEQVAIELADGSVETKSTDADGRVEVKNIDPGSCKISFPNLDADAWEPA